ncbi:MAG: alkaline phosphatase family protein, partial [Gemmatimonadales bacterium]
MRTRAAYCAQRTAIAVVVSGLVAACGSPDTKKVLLIGLDGVRVDILAQAATPNIDALIANGTFSEWARTGTPTVSGPGWSSMLTGVWPEKHGVHSN